jgi:SAM-dependent methyltransferase
MLDDDSELLNEQISYYESRAREYDEWFFRRGRYDRGRELNERWFAEAGQVRLALHDFKPTGRVLEIACGTGLWTQQILPYAGRITALDAVPEMLAINRERLAASKVSYLRADVFEWQPDGMYDVVFFGFWLSHVPAERFRAFWDLVGRALKPNGRVFFIDSRYEPTSTAKDHALGDSPPGIVVRRLNDGREFRIVKIFYETNRLTSQLNELGWNFDIKATPTYFIYGSGVKRK